MTTTQTTKIETLISEKKRLRSVFTPVNKAYKEKLDNLLNSILDYITVPSGYETHVYSRTLTIKRGFGDEMSVSLEEDLDFKTLEYSYRVSIAWSNRPNLELMKLAGQIADWSEQAEESVVKQYTEIMNAYRPVEEEFNSRFREMEAEIRKIESDTLDEKALEIIEEAKGHPIEVFGYGGVSRFRLSDNNSIKIRILKETPKQYKVGIYSDCGNIKVEDKTFKKDALKNVIINSIKIENKTN